MTRLPLRWRLTLAFSGAMLVVFAALGAVVYQRLAAEQRAALDRGLRVRAAEVAALVEASPEGLRRVSSGLETDESAAQVVRADGSIAASTPGIGVSLADAALLRRGLRAPVAADRDGDARVDESLRLLVAPARLNDGPAAVVVAASRDEDSEALAVLLLFGGVGLAVALVVASAAGYAVAGAALRPVEAMRARAAEISERPDRRLPVPPADDELRALAHTLNEMLSRLDRAAARERDALDRQRRFVADASHELRTPLAVLKSEIEVALMGVRPASELRAALASAGEETDRLCRLAEDLLTLAEADEGGAPATEATVDVHEVLIAVAARERRRAETAKRRIAVDAPSGLLVRADRLGLERAVGNLVDNALRHGGGTVELRGGRSGDRIVIEVRDHGRGLPPGFEQDAFRRFRRGTDARGDRGTGLGLALVRAVADAHRGSATIEDAHPGALARIRLPAAAP